MTSKKGYVYILASRRNGTLYVGVTSDLFKRIWQHRNGETKGFASRFGATILVWFEAHDEMTATIAREKAIKKWYRAWKLRLIEEANPEWNDLYPEISGFPPSRE